MKIFLAGATGAMGRQLVPGLVAAGHDVVGTTRRPAKVDDLKALGAEPVVLDALDRDAVIAAVSAAEPDVVIHQLTALAEAKPNFRNVDKSFVMTNELRTRGLDHLLEAAVKAGARRFVAQSFAGWPTEQTGGPIKTEEDPLMSDPPPTAAKSFAAIRHVETTVPAAAGIEGLVLRYGGFYGPGTAMTRGGEMLELVVGRKLPIVGNGAGVFSFVHIADAAAATVLAVDRGTPGVYNITDDAPAPVSTWLPELADILGAKKPFRVPAWLLRPLIGKLGVALMTSARGASNAKAKRELGWALRYPSWRQGFRTGLDAI